VRFAATALCAMVLAGSGAMSADAPQPIRIVFGTMDPPVLAQRDITVRAPISNQNRTDAPLECSGLACVGGRLVISSDRHENALFITGCDPVNFTVIPPTPRVIIENERDLLVDLENLTARPSLGGGTWLYGLCSLSNDRSELPLPKRRHMLRAWIDKDGQPDPHRTSVLRVDHLRHELNILFMAHGVRPYRSFYQDSTTGNKNTYRWGNVEGITFTPDQSLLLCGMRNPLADGDAICFTISRVPDAFDANDPTLMRITDVFNLNLQRRGVSDIAWDPVSNGYLVLGAKSAGPKLNNDAPYPPDQLDAALFWWSGRKDDPPRLIADIPDMTAEAITRLDNSPVIVIGTDEGDVSEGRPERQSRLLFLYFTGSTQQP